MKLAPGVQQVPWALPVSLCSQEAQLHHWGWGCLLWFPREPADGLLLLGLGFLL